MIKFYNIILNIILNLFFFLVNSDIIALNMYKDEVITINNNNNITFSPLNENVRN